MLNVLIVDDEKNIREGLRYIIDWESYGFKVIEVLGSSVSSLEYISKNRPDVVITDIRMPDMDGLKLIEQARLLSRHIKFIVLSGYDDFDYAQQAIKLKIEGYLLKPIEEDELIECLKRIKAEHHELSGINREHIHNLLQSILSGNHNTKLKTDDFFSEIDGSYYYLLAEPYQNEISFSSVKHEHDEEKLKHFVNNFMDENEGFYAVNDGRFQGLVINEATLFKAGKTIKEFAGSFQLLLSENGVNASIIAGEKANTLFDIYNSRLSMNLCFNHKFYRGNGQVFIHSELSGAAFSDGLSEAGLLEEVIRAVVKGDREEIIEKIASLCDALTNEMVLPDTVKIYISNIIVSLIRELDEAGCDRGKILAQYALYGKITAATVRITKVFLEELCLDVSKQLLEIRKEKSTGVISEIIYYVRENYTEDLKLQNLSNKYYVNTAYLGQLFKKYTGATFNSFLTRIRVEEAKKLLLKNDLKIYEIALKVGFKDPNYFYVKFEELEKTSPKQYRENSLNT